jgi:c-di-GMP-binding flagellar brake protein YcgR
MARLFGGKNKADNIEAGHEEEIEFLPGRIFSLAKERQARHTSKLLNKQGGGRLLFGVYADREYEFDYKENDVVAASFVELKVLYNFNVRILRIRELVSDAGEGFEIDRAANQLDSIHGYRKFIVEAVSLGAPEKQQRREFFRMALKVDIYYKIIMESELADIAGSNMKFNLAAGGEEAKAAGFLETVGGYQKLTTADISAGGFRCSTEVPLEEGSLLDCIIITGFEALPAIAKALHMRPDPQNPGLFEIRAIFCKISDSVRDRIVKYILDQQKLLRARFLGTR